MGSRVISVTIGVKILLRRFGLNCSKSTIQVLYFLVTITVGAYLLPSYVGLVVKFLAPVVYLFLEFPS